MWTPPLGIPRPSFGIDEVPPALQSWSAPIAGFYCVDERRGLDASNPFGTPVSPRRTIPQVLPAGSTVVVLGDYTQSLTSPNTLLAQGTATAPVFIVGVNTSFRSVEISGTYCIIQPLNANYYTKAYSIVTRDGRNGEATHHVAVRDVEVAGDVYGGGCGTAKWGAGSVSDIVWLRMNIHDLGDLNTTTDQDHHGIGIGLSQRVWVLDSTMTRCSGDSIQINAGALTNNPALRYVYMGRCKGFGNRQSAGWAKFGSDIVFSENEGYGHRPGVGTLGAQFGCQYGPDRIWFINNKAHDGEFGIYVASYSDGANGSAFIINNRVWGCTNSATSEDAASPWNGGAGLLLPGAPGGRWVLNNTINGCDGGVQVPAAGGALLLYNNIITNIRRQSLNVESPTMSANGILQGTNFYDATTNWMLAGTNHVLSTALINAIGSYAGDPMFADADFRLQAGSGALAHATTINLSDYYQSIHGVPLNTDALGTVRVPTYDLGACELI